jgi:hypothetical protein
VEEEDRLTLERRDASEVAGAPQAPADRQPGAERIPEGSTFYTRILPLILALMALLTAALVLIALGVLTGVISFH